MKKKWPMALRFMLSMILLLCMMAEKVPAEVTNPDVPVHVEVNGYQCTVVLADEGGSEVSRHTFSQDTAYDFMVPRPLLKTDRYQLSVLEEPDGDIWYDRTVYDVVLTAFIYEDGHIETVTTGTYEAEKEKTEKFTFTNYVIPKNPPTTSVDISKVELTGGAELPGARLVITDEETGKVVDEWTSTDKPHRERGLVIGRYYILTEITAPEGYVRAESIRIRANAGNIETVTMEDDVTKVLISKTDITGTKELPGATLTITDERGNVIETWVSGEEAHYIEKLPVGTYTLREERAPEGYLIAEDIRFTVMDTGEIQKVIMQDEEVPGDEVPDVPEREKPEEEEDIPGKPENHEIEIRDRGEEIREHETPEGGFQGNEGESPRSPKTGDGSFQYLVFILMSLSAVIFMVNTRRRQRS